jgi:hypothetical protein
LSSILFADKEMMVSDRNEHAGDANHNRNGSEQRSEARPPGDWFASG